MWIKMLWARRAASRTVVVCQQQLSTKPRNDNYNKKMFRKKISENFKPVEKLPQLPQKEIRPFRFIEEAGFDAKGYRNYKILLFYFANDPNLLNKNDIVARNLFSYIKDHGLVAKDPTLVAKVLARWWAVGVAEQWSGEVKNVMEQLKKENVIDEKMKWILDAFKSTIFDESFGVEKINLELVNSSIFKRDLVHVIAAKELKKGNFDGFRTITDLTTLDLSLKEDLVMLLMEKMEQGKISRSIVWNWLTDKMTKEHDSYISSIQYEASYTRLMRATRAEIDQIFNANGNLKDFNLPPKSFVSGPALKECLKLLYRTVAESNQGKLSTKEVKLTIDQVHEWKRQWGNKSGEDVVVVDALNVGSGTLPKKSVIQKMRSRWKKIVLVVRSGTEREAQGLSEHVLVTSRISSDDVLVLCAAMAFGPRVSLVTNDKYRDHLEYFQGESRKSFAAFFADSVYKYDKRKGIVDTPRNFNLVVKKMDNDTSLFVPILKEVDGASESATFQYFVSRRPLD